MCVSFLSNNWVAVRVSSDDDEIVGVRNTMMDLQE